MTMPRPIWVGLITIFPISKESEAIMIVPISMAELPSIIAHTTMFSLIIGVASTVLASSGIGVIIITMIIDLLCPLRDHTGVTMVIDTMFINQFLRPTIDILQKIPAGWNPAESKLLFINLDMM